MLHQAFPGARLRAPALAAGVLSTGGVVSTGGDAGDNASVEARPA